MWEIQIISFTEKGHEKNCKLADVMRKKGIFCESFQGGRKYQKKRMKEIEDMKNFLECQWGKKAFLFIGAVGIAVRYIAPFVKDKFTDSPVLVMDEKGKFVIPLLSGHMGGAVEMAAMIAELIQATPVVTTATDINGVFAVDLFARKNGMRITDRMLAKKISSTLLAKERVGFYSEVETYGSIPDGLEVCNDEEELAAYKVGIAVRMSHHPEKRKGVLYLYPKVLWIGVGCRKGVTKEKMKGELEELLKKKNFGTEQIAGFASIDRKAKEKGILELSEEYQVPFLTYTAEALNHVSEVSSSSDFVMQTVGTDNVCERAAILAGYPGTVVQQKIKKQDMTFAIVRTACKIDMTTGKGQ